MRIGLVVAGIPTYSETFLRKKIAYLQGCKETEIMLLCDRVSTDKDWSLCKVVFNVSLDRGHFISGIVFAYHLVKTLFLHPLRFVRLLRLNRSSGMPVKANLISIVRSSHMLGLSLDWIHFAFGTLAVGRENVARVIGAKMAVSFRGFDHYVFPLKNPGCYRNVFQKADKFHVLSRGMQQDLIRSGVPLSRVTVITPAIDVRQFSFSGRPLFTDGVVRIVTVARLHWIKGLEYTLEALALLVEMGVKFRYIIVGEGEEKERLLFASHQLGIASYVSFVGKVSHDQVTSFMEDADIYLQYSIQEGFCNAVLEAQSMGLLCVVSDADGLKENVVHEKTGWIVPKRQPSALAHRISEILKLNPSAISAIRENAIARVRAQFDLAFQKAAFLEFYSLD